MNDSSIIINVACPEAETSTLGLKYLSPATVRWLELYPDNKKKTGSEKGPETVTLAVGSLTPARVDR